MAEERGEMTESSIPGVREDKFGWQEDAELTYYDSDGNEITEAEWRERMRLKAEARKTRKFRG